MKYSEFETIAKKNGWDFDIDEEPSGWVYVSKYGFKIEINKSTRNYMDLYTEQGGAIGLSEEKEFIKACYELAETPIEDRGDVKRYVVELPFCNYKNTKIFLNGFLGEPYWSDECYRRYSEKEIKEIDPRLWEFAVEVENEAKI